MFSAWHQPVLWLDTVEMTCWSICKWVEKTWPVCCFSYSTLASCCRKTYTLGKPKHSFPWKNQKHQPLAPSWCTHWSKAREPNVPAGSSPAKRPLLPQQSCQWPEVLSTTQVHRHPASFTFLEEPNNQQCFSPTPATCQLPAVWTWVSTVCICQYHHLSQSSLQGVTASSDGNQ